MDTTNPYQAPRTEKSIASEQKFASRLLSLRDAPLTLGKLYRLQVKAQFLLFLMFGVAIAYFTWFNLQPGVYLMLGALAGSLLRDFGIMRVQTKLWPIQNKVLDWQKVQRMAEGRGVVSVISSPATTGH